MVTENRVQEQAFYDSLLSWMRKGAVYAPTDYRVSAEAAPQVVQQGAQMAQQLIARQQQMQMQQAVAASVAKGYLSSLQQRGQQQGRRQAWVWG